MYKIIWNFKLLWGSIVYLFLHFFQNLSVREWSQQGREVERQKSELYTIDIKKRSVYTGLQRVWFSKIFHSRNKMHYMFQWYWTYTKLCWKTLDYYFPIHESKLSHILSGNLCEPILSRKLMLVVQLRISQRNRTKSKTEAWPFEWI